MQIYNFGKWTDYVKKSQATLNQVFLHRIQNQPILWIRDKLKILFYWKYYFNVSRDSAFGMWLLQIWLFRIQRIDDLIYFFKSSRYFLYNFCRYSVPNCYTIICDWISRFQVCSCLKNHKIRFLIVNHSHC